MQTNSSISERRSTLNRELAKRGLECHLVTKNTRESAAEANQGMYDKLKTTIAEAYDRDDLTPEHFQFESWAVTLNKIDELHAIVACCTLSFYSGFPSYFQVGRPLL
jgi:hypothetical protein